MEEADQGESPPFWVVSNPPHHHRHRSSNLLLRPWFALIVAPILGLLLLLFAIPYLFSFLGRVLFRHPNHVKKSWDTLNLFLVAFAIICGILSRGSNNNSSSSNNHIDSNNISTNNRIITSIGDNEEKLAEKSGSSSNDNTHQIPKWLEQYSTYPRPFNLVEPNTPSTSNPTTTTFGRLRRSSSSYPDLRQESWVSSGETGSSHSHDDMGLSNRWQSDQPRRRHRRRSSYGEKDAHDSDFKTIKVDSFSVGQFSAALPSLSPPPPAAAAAKQKVRRTFQTLPQREEKEEKQQQKALEMKKSRQAPPPPPPAPPPPPPLPQRSDGKSSRKSVGGAKDIKSTLAFLYNQRKKRKQKNKSNHDSTVVPSSSSSPSSLSPPASNLPPSTPPPPPPPPPPASVFHNIFSYKKPNKSKRIHSISAPPPPPPPPPRRPPMPTSTRKVLYDREDNLSSGSRSPLIPMPPPPPPPPFRMQALKFAVRGDFVRVQSGLSDSSDSTEFIEIPSEEANVSVSNATVFCPSPDVNTKADSFIARFRAGLKLEKMNSIREKEKMGSKAPDQTTQPSPS